MKTSPLYFPSDRRPLASAIAGATGDLIITTDAVRRIVSANPSTCKLTGFSRKELTGAKLAFIWPEKRRARMTSKIGHAIQHAAVWAGEMEVRKKDGSVLRVQASVAAVRDADGKIAGLVLVGRDLTGRRLLDRQEWESHDRLLSIFETMDDAVAVCDRDGKILLCNSAHCRILGYAQDEIIGAELPYPWLDDDDARKLRHGLKLLSRSGTLRNCLVSWRRRDRSVIAESLSISVLGPKAGEVEGFVMVARDVTDVQYADELRRLHRQIERLVDVVRRKSERLSTLEEVNWMVLRNANISRIFKAITSGIGKLVPHDLAGIYVVDAARENLLAHTLSKQTAFSRRLAGFPIPLGEGIVGESAVTGKMVWVNNAQNDARSRYPEGMRPEKEHFIAVPLQGRGPIFGVLVVARNSDPEFLEEEASIVRSFADAATVALENARLFDQVHGRPAAKSPPIRKSPSAG